MVMSPPSTTTKKSEWAFYMLYTVRVNACGLLGIMLTPIRSWSVFRAISLDAVFHNEVLVLSLLLFTWSRGCQCSPGDGDIPFQNTGG